MNNFKTHAYKFRRNFCWNNVDSRKLESDRLLLSRLHLTLHLQAGVHRVDVEHLEPGAQIGGTLSPILLPVSGPAFQRVYVPGVRIRMTTASKVRLEPGNSKP